jgi:hypothetical protein
LGFELRHFDSRQAQSGQYLVGVLTWLRWVLAHTQALAIKGQGQQSGARHLPCPGAIGQANIGQATRGL